MHVLIVGDAVVKTGFSRCTHALADELHKRGHRVSILGINYWGDPHTYPYAIYPAVNFADHGTDAMGQTRLPRLIRRLKPDKVVLLNDPWNIQSYFDEMDAQLEPDSPRPVMIGWLAVDSENHRLGGMGRLDSIVVWTEFAKHEIEHAGYEGPISIVPLGIDAGKFRQVDKSEARKMVLPNFVGDRDDVFIVGAVGRNQHRKRLDLTLQSFAEFALNSREPKEHYRLYLHCAPTGDSGFDIKSLAMYYGLQGLVVQTVHGPDDPVPDAVLPYLYSSFDVYLSTSQGEGWGLPAQEAMACRVPCVLPNWGSFGSLGWVTGREALKVGCSHRIATAPFGGMLHTVGAVPESHDVAKCLRMIERDHVLRANLALGGERLANSLTLDLTGQGVASVVESTL